MRPLFSAAMVIGLACSLLALAYVVTRLLRRFGLAANTAVKLMFAGVGGATLAGVVGIPVLILGPALMRPWQLLAYFGWLFVLAVLASAVLVPLVFDRRQS